MSISKIRGKTQIIDKSINIDSIKDDFLQGRDWNITNGNNNATIKGLKDPDTLDSVATKNYIDNEYILNIKSYQENKNYRENDLISDPTNHSSLYIATTDFTASNFDDDVADNKLISLTDNETNLLVKTIKLNLNDNSDLVLANINTILNVFKKSNDVSNELSLTIDQYNFEFDVKFVKQDPTVKLRKRYSFKLDTSQQYPSTEINLTKFKDIFSILST